MNKRQLVKILILIGLLAFWINAIAWGYYWEIIYWQKTIADAVYASWWNWIQIFALPIAAIIVWVQMKVKLSINQ